MRIFLLALALLSAMPLATQAQNKPPTFAERFAMANTTHDGCLTFQQARAARMPDIVRNFALIDTRKKGCVTLDEIKLFRLQRKVQREQHL